MQSLVLERKNQGDALRRPAGENGDFFHPSGVEKRANQCMTSFMNCHSTTVLRACQFLVLIRFTHALDLDCFQDVVHSNFGIAAASGKKRCVVRNEGDSCWRQPHAVLGKAVIVQVFCRLGLA